MCLLRGAVLTVINVGDSRAVIAERSEGNLVAQDLSWDQTPMRPDECERCKAAGARVLTLDQLDGLKDSKIQSWTMQVWLLEARGTWGGAGGGREKYACVARGMHEHTHAASRRVVLCRPQTAEDQGQGSRHTHPPPCRWPRRISIPPLPHTQATVWG